MPTSDSDGQDERHRGKRYVELEVDDDMIIGPSGSGSCLEYCSDCVFFLDCILSLFVSFLNIRTSHKAPNSLSLLIIPSTSSTLTPPFRGGGSVTLTVFNLISVSSP